MEPACHGLDLLIAESFHPQSSLIQSQPSVLSEKSPRRYKWKEASLYILFSLASVVQSGPPLKHVLARGSLFGCV